jgi:hypothetical protein
MDRCRLQQEGLSQLETGLFVLRSAPLRAPMKSALQLEKLPHKAAEPQPSAA